MKKAVLAIILSLSAVAAIAVPAQAAPQEILIAGVRGSADMSVPMLRICQRYCTADGGIYHCVCY
jgi:hypothetical protein